MKSFFFILIIFMVTVTGCKRDCCDINDDCPPIKQQIRLRVLDKITNEDLIFDGHGNFNAQILKIFYTSNNLSDTIFYPITPRNHPEGYRIATFLIDADTIAYLKFIGQKKIDTLNTIGLWQKVDCGAYYLEYLYLNKEILCEYCDDTTVNIIYK